MARPVTITQEAILEAAREVFLERGIRATTAEIAQRAGVSEGSVFNRFKTKQELFQAAFRLGGFEPRWLKNLPALVGKDDLEGTLYNLAMEVLHFFTRLMPLMVMAGANPMFGAEGAGPPRVHDSPPAVALKRLSAFFDAEMRTGRLRRHDPEILARAFLGGLWQHAAFSTFFLPEDELPMPTEQFVRGFVHLLLTGARAPRS